MNEMAQIIAQTILVRDLQKQYFASRKGQGAYPSKESRIILKASRQEEIILDTMLTNYVQAFDGLMTIENRTETHISPNQLSLEL